MSIFINIITDEKIYIDNKEYEWTNIFSFINDFIWQDVYLVCGPSNYVGVRKAIAILKALQTKYSFNIYFFDILIHYLPNESAFIKQNIIWYKSNNTIKIVSDIKSDVISNCNYDCSSMALRNFINNNHIIFLNEPKYFDKLTEII